MPELDNPLLEHLGVRLLEAGAGRCVLELSLEERHLNRSRTLHGGVTATLLDAACGYAGLASADGDHFGQGLTLMLSVSYLDKCDQGRVRATGSVRSAGRGLYFCSGELHAEDGRLLATAQGTFKRSWATAPR